ncbi:hypothetical protein Tco_0835139 [Tanacetum coccineum]
MPKATTTDISLTKSYIPKVSKIPGISPTISQFYKPIENRNIHEGRVVDQAYYKSNNIERLFMNIRFNYLFQINEPIVLRFILDFYSQVTVQTDDYGDLVISFMIQHEFITLTLAQFGQILKIPYNGQAVFTNEWDLASLEYSRETEGPYCTDLPTPDDIRRLLELERVVVDRTIKSQTVTLNPNQILTKELSPDMKQWEELIRENVFGLGGHRDRLPACLAHMLYCVVAEEQYNLAYFFVKRIECARATPTANLPYGMFLTRLYRHVMETYPHLDNGIDDTVDRVMRPLALRQTRRPRSDRGKARHSVSSSSSHHQGTFSHVRLRAFHCVIHFYFFGLRPISMGHSTYGCRRVSKMDPYKEVAQQGQAAPPSPAYVPDHMELDHHVSVYIPEHVYPKYLVPSDDDILVEDQEEDPIDYVADVDDDEEEESFEDDDDEEEEHLAPTDSTVIASPAIDHVPSAYEIEPFETDEFAATPPPPAYHTTSRIRRADIIDGRPTALEEGDRAALRDEVDTLRRYLSSLCTTLEQERVRARQALDRSEAHKGFGGTDCSFRDSGVSPRVATSGRR